MLGVSPQRGARYAWHTRPDPAHDLVPDRPQPFGPVLGADDVLPLAADQDDLVPDRNATVTDVHHQLIHGHDTDDRAAPAPDQHLRTWPVRQSPEPPRHAVGITDRDRREGRVTLEAMPPAVRDVTAGGD